MVHPQFPEKTIFDNMLRKVVIKNMKHPTVCKFCTRSSVKKDTATKVILFRIINFCLVCIGFSYVLAFLGREQIAESLSQTMVTAIIGTFIGYAAKSYFETKSEKSLEFEKEKHIESNRASDK